MGGNNIIDSMLNGFKIIFIFFIILIIGVSFIGSMFLNKHIYETNLFKDNNQDTIYYNNEKYIKWENKQ